MTTKRPILTPAQADRARAPLYRLTRQRLETLYRKVAGVRGPTLLSDAVLVDIIVWTRAQRGKETA